MPRDEYVLDVPYPRTFVADIAPPKLRLVAALNGLPAPPGDDFDYCDLGCAHGDTLGLLAAANPGGRFVGVDLNPAHTEVAGTLARRGGLANVRIVQQDFAALSQEGLPSFDFIVAHGIWSWVGAETRAAVLDFVRTHLKPDGLFYVSYNTLPGWSAIAPLRRLLRDHAARASGSTLDRVRAAMDYVQRLVDGGAGYFANHPTARSMVSLMREGGPAYVIHEYFHASWTPYYSADVARELADAGFSFAGELPLSHNLRELATPPNVKKLADAVRDRAEFETLKDFATNELFRGDVFVKGAATRSPDETRDFFESTPMGTMTSPIRREAKLPFYTLDYKGPIYEPIVRALEQGAASAMTLAHDPALAPMGQGRIGSCLMNLVLGGQVVPMRPRAETATGGEARLLPYNEVALDEALAGRGPLAFAAPATGTAVHLSLFEAIALRLITGVAPAERDAWLASYATRTPMPLVVGDRKVKDLAELRRLMPREVERVTALLPKLTALGVVTRAEA